MPLEREPVANVPAARRMRRMLRIFGRCRGVVRKPGVSSSMVVLAPPGVGAAIDARASGDTTNEDSSAVAGVRWLFAAASEYGVRWDNRKWEG